MLGHLNLHSGKKRQFTSASALSTLGLITYQTKYVSVTSRINYCDFLHPGNRSPCKEKRKKNQQFQLVQNDNSHYNLGTQSDKLTRIHVHGLTEKLIITSPSALLILCLHQILLGKKPGTLTT